MSRFNLILLAIVGVLVAAMLGSTMGKVSALEKRVDHLDDVELGMADKRCPIINGKEMRPAQGSCWDGVQVWTPNGKPRWVSGAKMPGPITNGNAVNTSPMLPFDNRCAIGEPPNARYGLCDGKGFPIASDEAKRIAAKCGGHTSAVYVEWHDMKCPK